MLGGVDDSPRRPACSGFYDVSNDNNRPEGLRLTNVLRSKLEGKSQAQIEADKRKDDLRVAEEKGELAPPAVAAINRYGEHYAHRHWRADVPL